MKINTVTITRLSLFIMSFVLYVLTQNPTVTFIDSGELAGTFSTLGVAHPTGYPLFTVLAFIWTKILFFMPKINALNTLAGVFTAFSVVSFYNVICAIRQRLKIKMPDLDFIPVASAFTYATALTVWQQATSVEVYSLHIVLIQTVLYFLISGSTEQNSRKILIAGFALGLSFANHLTTVLLLPGILFFYFMNSWRNKSDNNIFTIRLFIQTLLVALIPLTLYIYLPLRSASGALFNWGGVHRSLDKFMYHVQGKQYQVWMFSDSEAFSKNFDKFIHLMPYQLSIVGILLAALGIWYFIKKDKILLSFILILILTCALYSFNYSINDIDTYFLLAFIGFSYLAFGGLLFLFSKIKKINPAFALILPVINITINYKTADRSNDYYVHDYTQSVINGLEKDAVVISSQWDFWVSSMWYFQKVENQRNDIIVIDKELVRRTWYADQLKRWYPPLKVCQPEFDAFMPHLQNFENGQPYDQMQIQATFNNLLNSFIDKFIETRPVYLTLDVLQTSPELGQKYQKIPQGFAFKLTKKLDTMDFDINLLKLDRMKKTGLEAESYEEKIVGLSSANLTIQAKYFLAVGNKEKALIFAKRALEINPDNNEASLLLSQLQQR